MLDEFIEDKVFAERDWSNEEDAPVLNISILDICKKAELTDYNKNIFKWVHKSIFNNLGYCYELQKIIFNHLVKMMVSFQNIFKIDKFIKMFKNETRELFWRKIRTDITE